MLEQTNTFSSTVNPKSNINCRSKGDCNKQYVGEIGTPFSTRHYKHRSDISKKPHLPLFKHFLQGRCSFEHISIIGFELHKGDSKSRKRKKGWW